MIAAGGLVGLTGIPGAEGSLQDYRSTTHRLGAGTGKAVPFLPMEAGRRHSLKPLQALIRSGDA